MPALDVQNPGVSVVASFGSLLHQFLEEAAVVKPTSTIEPTLKKSNFKDISNRISACVSSDTTTEKDGQDSSPQELAKAKQFAVIETAARDLFDTLIVGDKSHSYLSDNDANYPRPRPQ